MTNDPEHRQWPEVPQEDNRNLPPPGHLLDAIAERNGTVATQALLDMLHMSRHTRMDEYLIWNGIIGFTDQILEVADYRMNHDDQFAPYRRLNDKMIDAMVEFLTEGNNPYDLAIQLLSRMSTAEIEDLKVQVGKWHALNEE